MTSGHFSLQHLLHNFTDSLTSMYSESEPAEPTVCSFAFSLGTRHFNRHRIFVEFEFKCWDGSLSAAYMLYSYVHLCGAKPYWEHDPLRLHYTSTYQSTWWYRKDASPLYQNFTSFKIPPYPFIFLCLFAVILIHCCYSYVRLRCTGKAGVRYFVSPRRSR